MNLCFVFCSNKTYFIPFHSATIRPLKMKNMSSEMFLFAYIISCDKLILKVNKRYSNIDTKCLGYLTDIHYNVKWHIYKKRRKYKAL